MNVTYYKDMEQGTDEWHEARLGIVTASEVNELVTPLGHNKMAPTKKTGKLADGVIAYAAKIASQRVNKRIEDSFESFAMMKGTFHEEYARAAYNDNYEDVIECGFITRDFGVFKLGCSPDGLVGDDGGIEIKSREAKFQVATVFADEVPKEYINQCQTFLIASGRKWVDFVQYSSGMALYVKRVYPDKERQEQICDALRDFEVLVKKIEASYIKAAKSMIQTERVEFVIDGVVTESKGEIE